MIGFILSVPLAYNIGIENLREFQENFFKLFGIVLISLFLGNIWITAFLILNVVLLNYGGGTVGYSQVINVFIGAIIFLVSRAYFSRNKFQDLYRVFLWIAVLNIIWMTLQIFGIDPIYIGQDASGQALVTETFTNNIGLFGIKMANGIFMALIIPILASVNIWLAPFMLVPLYFCRSSAVALAIFVSTSFFLYQTRKRLFIWFVAFGILAGSAYVIYDLKDDPETFKSRFPVWHSALKYSLSQPQGYGPDSYRNTNKVKTFVFVGDEKYRHAIAIKQQNSNDLLFKYYDPDNGRMENNYKNIVPKQVNYWDNPHNEYLQMLFEYGFLGLFILIGFMREIFFRFKYSTKDEELIVITSCLIVYFVCGICHFPIHLARLGCLFPIFLGAFYSKTDTN